MGRFRCPSGHGREWQRKNALGAMNFGMQFQHRCPTCLTIPAHVGIILVVDKYIVTLLSNKYLHAHMYCTWYFLAEFQTVGGFFAAPLRLTFLNLPS